MAAKRQAKPMSERRAEKALKSRLESIHALGQQAADLMFASIRKSATVGELLMMGMAEANADAETDVLAIAESYGEDITVAMSAHEAAELQILDCYRQIAEHLWVIDTEIMPGVLAAPAFFRGKTFLEETTGGVGTAMRIDDAFLEDFDPGAAEPRHPERWIKRFSAPLTLFDVQCLFTLADDWETLQRALVWRREVNIPKEMLDLVGALKLINIYRVETS